MERNTRNTTIHLRMGLLLAAMACAPGVACSSASGSGSGSSPSGASDLCSTVGNKATSCNSAIDKTTLANDCANQVAALLPKLRSDVVSSLDSCVQSSDCTHVSSFVTDCLNTETASIAPSGAAMQFCGDLAKAKMKCSSGTVDEAICLDNSKIFSDGALSSADSCASHACGDIDGCVTSALGGTGAISTGSSGSSTGSSGSSGSSTGSSGGTAACQPDLNTTTRCGSCLEQYCCPQVVTCFGDPSCAQCTRGGTCSNDAPTTILNNCIAAHCTAACPPKT
jgi:hypothetical protein